MYSFYSFNLKEFIKANSGLAMIIQRPEKEAGTKGNAKKEPLNSDNLIFYEFFLNELMEIIA